MEDWQQAEVLILATEDKATAIASGVEMADTPRSLSVETATTIADTSVKLSLRTRHCIVVDFDVGPKEVTDFVAEDVLENVQTGTAAPIVIAVVSRDQKILSTEQGMFKDIIERPFDPTYLAHRICTLLHEQGTF